MWFHTVSCRGHGSSRCVPGAPMHSQRPQEGCSLPLARVGVGAVRAAPGPGAGGPGHLAAAPRWSEALDPVLPAAVGDTYCCCCFSPGVTSFLMKGNTLFPVGVQSCLR